MTHRRPPRSSPAGDFRAVAADRPQRTLALPVHIGSATRKPTSTPIAWERASEAAQAGAARPDEPDVELRLRRGPDGPRVTVRARLTCRAGDELRRLAERLQHAADALDRSKS